jgi:glycosidase
MLLISGRGLESAKASVDYPGISVSRVEARPNGHFLFVWLKIDSTAKPGKAKLKIAGSSGTAAVDFPVLARKPHRPAGITEDDVIYLIMPDRFANGNTANDNPPESPGQTDRADAHKWHGGDIKGVTDHLAYLKELGVTVVWLTPWWKQAPTTSDYHGYGTVDFYAVEPHLGTMAELQELSAAAHKLGMKLVMDYVVNHTGPLHPWNQDPPLATWLHGTAEHHPPFDYDFAQIIDPHSVPRQYRPVLEGWFADTLPDLNPDDPHVEAYLRDNTIWWMEMAGLDGLRLDTFPYSSRAFWQQWHSDLRKVYPKLWTLGEISNGDPWITSYFAGGRKQNDGIDSGVATVFDFPLTYAIREITLHEGDATSIVGILQHDSLYPHPDALVTQVSNHDMRRYMGEQGATIDKLKAAVALLLTLRGVPELYSGDEIAMPGGDDPDNRRDFPGGFAGDPRSAFTASGRTPEEQQVFEQTQTLLRLRREHAALRRGTLHHIEVAKDHYAFIRESDEDRLLVVFNSQGRKQQLSLDLNGTPMENTRMLEAVFGATPAEINDRHAILEIGASGVAIYKVVK